jgi:hypothetical protein
MSWWLAMELSRCAWIGAVEPTPWLRLERPMKAEPGKLSQSRAKPSSGNTTEWCTKLLRHLTFNSFNSRNELEGDFIPNLDVTVMAQDIDNIQELRGIGLIEIYPRARRTRFRGRR